MLKRFLSFFLPSFSQTSLREEKLLGADEIRSVVERS